MIKDERVARLLNLMNAAFSPPAGIPRILLALSFGFIYCFVIKAELRAILLAIFV